MILYKFTNEIFNIVIVSLFCQYFLKEVNDGHVEGLVMILAIGAEGVLLIIYLGLIATIGYFLDIFSDIAHAVTREKFKKLKEVFLF